MLAKNFIVFQLIMNHKVKLNQNLIVILTRMMRTSFNFPAKTKALLALIGVSFGGLFITRIIFYFFNMQAFEGMGLYYWFLGFCFDIITLSLWMLPFYFLFLQPLRFDHKWYRLAQKIIFHVLNSLLLAFNLVDVEYFRYTGKRSTADLFTTVSTGSDFGQLIGSFLTDFWHLILFLILLIWFSEFFYRKIIKKWDTSEKSLKIRVLIFVVGLTFLFLIGRGGFGLKPVGIIEAAKYTDGKYTAFVLPTPFTIIKTIAQKGLEEKHYFKSQNELRKYFNPIKNSSPKNLFEGKPNVVVIILESFGQEFVGHYNKSSKFTPFLDSILDRSLTFDLAYANGKKSIEAVPAIFAGIPTLMDDPYISSPYGLNQIDGLPGILKKHGYSSGFFHGATNGSMSFDGFARICGFEKYVGRTEYNNEKDSDDHWGILDEYFNPWTAKELSKFKEPFFSTLFTLSSHHPYFIPEHMKNKVIKGSQEICASINYADYALKLFFEEAKKQKWYNNTIFVLMADHTPATSTKIYNEHRNLYRIPIAFYDPSGRIRPERNTRIIQHIDVGPTLLDLMNIKTSYYSFGSSIYQQSKGEAISYISGSYFYFYENNMYVFTDDRIIDIQDLNTGKPVIPDKEIRKKVELRIKAIIQTYNHDMITNGTRVK